MNVLQIYYYTGDPQVEWRGSSRAVVSNGNWSFRNRFFFIDAGSHDPTLGASPDKREEILI